MNFDSGGETREHIRQVAERLRAVCRELEARGERHDASKLGEVEKPHFDAVGSNLRDLVYDSDDYHAARERIRPALAHHYAHNSHHPEHYPNGVAGMDLIDLVEMYCDWAAATLRTRDGDLARSIALNAGRFGIAAPLSDILENTWKRYGGFSGQPERNEPLPPQPSTPRSGTGI
jgi:hypothetical protein